MLKPLHKGYYIVLYSMYTYNQSVFNSYKYAMIYSYRESKGCTLNI